jgi:hypothetical protein
MIKAAVEDFQDRRAGGQLIDLRATQAIARRDPGVEAGRVVIRWPDGTAEVRVDVGPPIMCVATRWPIAAGRPLHRHSSAVDPNSRSARHSTDRFGGRRSLVLSG